MNTIIFFSFLFVSLKVCMVITFGVLSADDFMGAYNVLFVIPGHCLETGNDAHFVYVGQSNHAHSVL